MFEVFKYWMRCFGCWKFVFEELISKFGVFKWRFVWSVEYG